MEVQRPRVAVIPTHTAGASGLRNEHLLDLATAPRDRCRATSLTPVVALLIEHERGLSMMLATQHHHTEPCLLGPSGLDSPTPPVRPMRLESVISQPVPHRSLADGRLIGDLRNRHASTNQGLQSLASQPATRLILGVMRSTKPVLLEPVGDSRFVSPNRRPISASDNPCSSSCSKGARSMQRMLARTYVLFCDFCP